MCTECTAKCPKGMQLCLPGRHHASIRTLSSLNPGRNFHPVQQRWEVEVLPLCCALDPMVQQILKFLKCQLRDDPDEIFVLNTMPTYADYATRLRTVMSKCENQTNHQTPQLRGVCAAAASWRENPGSFWPSQQMLWWNLGPGSADIFLCWNHGFKKKWWCVLWVWCHVAFQNSFSGRGCMLLGLQVKLPSWSCSLQILNFKSTMKDYQIVHDCRFVWTCGFCNRLG